MNKMAKIQKGPSGRYQTLLRIMNAANARLDPARVIQLIMDNIRKLIPCEAWSILLPKEDRNELRFERVRGQGADRLIYATLKVGEGIAGWVAQNREAVIVNNVQRDPRFDSRFDQVTDFKTKSILCVPLLSRNALLGVVELINKQIKNYKFTREDLRTLSSLLGPIAVSLHNAMLFREKEYLSITDDLTKLYNNRYVNNFLNDLIRNGQAKRQTTSIIFLDLDGFKSVNDQYGHLVGGRTLVEVGRIIFESVRKTDVVARYGGDEFIVILPGSGAPEAFKIAEKIRRAIKTHDYRKGLQKEIRLSASFGISVYPAHGKTVTELIQKADNAMYSVKYSGKDAVQLAQ